MEASVPSYFWRMKLNQQELKDSDGRTYATIYYDTELNATVDVWIGQYGDIENLKRGLMLVLDNIAIHKSKKWLADISKLEGDFQEAKDFIAPNVIPKAMDLGLMCEAVVLPNEVLALISVQEAGSQLINHFELRMFAKVQDAIEWLATK
jgi:hypothetical protein